MPTMQVPEGCRIWVTRPAEQAASLCERIARAGGHAESFPVIELESLPEPRLSTSLEGYDMGIFISANAVRFTFEQLEPETTLYEFTGLVRSLQNLVNRMENTHMLTIQVQKHLLEAIQAHDQWAKKTEQALHDHNELLRRGFRLRDDE